jgi:mono/diheme cytochrome c family protein
MVRHFRGTFLCGAALAATSLALVVIGCHSVPPEVAAPAVAQLGVPQGQMAYLETGRAIYVGQCTHCHSAKPVSEYSAEAWTQKIMPRMAKKAKLTPEQTQTVLDYVLAARGVTPSPNGLAH